MAIFLKSSLHKYVICFFHDSLLSIKRPRNVVYSTKSIDVFMRERLPGKVELELLKSILRVFCTFNESLLQQIHS